MACSTDLIILDFVIVAILGRVQMVWITEI